MDVDITTRGSRRVQKGYLYKKSGAWMLRYSDGEKQCAKRLCSIADCRTKSEARARADEFLRPFNRDDSRASRMTLETFVETMYFPAADVQHRASTLYGYRNLWKNYLKPHARIGLAGFRTADGERILNAIAEGSSLSRTTLGHIKAFLSGVFRYAKRQAILGTENPMREVALPKAKAPEETHAYSLAEIARMLEVLPCPAATIVACAAFTGARKGELRGFSWEDYDGQEIRVARAWWRHTVDEPKTQKSKAPVPVIPQLRERLTGHRARQIEKIAGFRLKGEIEMRGLMFPNPQIAELRNSPDKRNGMLDAALPLDLDLLARDVIAPRLKAHGVVWHGWHAFRRGLATNLHQLGVQDKIIQRILRHSNVAVTQACYIKGTDLEIDEAMAKLAKASG